MGCQLTKKIKFVVCYFSTSHERSVEKGGVSHPLGESRAAVLYYSDPSPPPKFFKFNAPSTHLLQEEIRGPPRPRRRQLQSQWDYHEPEEIRGPPKPRDTLVFSPVIWRKKSEDHLDLGTLFICHPEENFQINKVGTNIVGSESTFQWTLLARRILRPSLKILRFHQIKKFRNYLTPKRSQEVQEFHLVQNYCVLNCVLKRKL